VSEEKICKIEKLIMDAVSKKVITIKHLAKIQGKIIALIRAFGFVARVASKSGYCLVEQHTKKFGWFGSVLLDQSTIG